MILRFNSYIKYNTYISFEKKNMGGNIEIISMDTIYNQK